MPASRVWRWLLEGGLLEYLTQTKATFTECLPGQVLGQTIAEKTLSCLEERAV